MKRSKKECESILYLSEGVVVEILSRLPGKSISRCKCVCKLWRNLIGSPNFVLSTSTTRRERAIVGCQHSNRCVDVKSDPMDFYSIDGELYVVKLPTPAGEVPTSYDNLHFLGSCNGLILFYADGRLYLWNPLTSCCRVITHCDALVNIIEKSYQRDSGLCFDKSCGDYKFVLLTTSRPHGFGQVAKFSACVASLKRRDMNMDISFPYRITRDGSHLCSPSGVLVNGHLHWLVMGEVDNAQLIVYFDGETNQFRECAMPEVNEYHDGCSDYYFGLGVLNGCLCMAKVVKQANDYVREYSDESDVLTMTDYGDRHSWTKLFSIRGVLVPVPTRISSNLVVVSRRYHVYTYNLEKKSSKKMKGPPHQYQKRSYNLKNRNNGRINIGQYNLRNNSSREAKIEPVVLKIKAGPLMYSESLKQLTGYNSLNLMEKTLLTLR